MLYCINMRILIFLFSLLTAFAANGKILRIAVIDTGLGYESHGLESNLCQYGHKDFTKQQQYIKIPGVATQVPLDTHGHGTNIAGIIDDNAGLVKNSYCLVIIKFYANVNVDGDALKQEIEAFKYAKELNVDIINFSGGGEHINKEELDTVKAYLDNHGVVIAAAGNESSSLDKKPYYPAMADKRNIIVGSRRNGKISYFSNYGPQVTRWEDGENVMGNGLSFSGTSQATAIVTGKIIVNMVTSYDNNRSKKILVAKRK